ncbi:MAG: hypothetical protein R6U92_07070 [Bacillota bacterium]
MVRINLLPPEILEARRRRSRWMKAVTIVGVGILALGAVLAFLIVDTMNLENQLADLEADKLRLEEEIAEYVEYEEMQAEVDAKTEIARAAMGRAQDWPSILTDIGTFIPQRVWLTNLTMNYPHGNGENGEATIDGSVQFQGLTYTHPSTALWLKRLEDIDGLAGARCRFSAETTHRDFELVSFELNSQLHPGPEYEPMSDRGDAR